MATYNGKSDAALTQIKKDLLRIGKYSQDAIVKEINNSVTIAGADISMRWLGHGPGKVISSSGSAPFQDTKKRLQNRMKKGYARGLPDRKKTNTAGPGYMFTRASVPKWKDFSPGYQKRRAQAWKKTRREWKQAVKNVYTAAIKRIGYTASKWLTPGQATGCRFSGGTGAVLKRRFGVGQGSPAAIERGLMRYRLRATVVKNSKSENSQWQRIANVALDEGKRKAAVKLQYALKGLQKDKTKTTHKPMKS